MTQIDEKPAGGHLRLVAAGVGFGALFLVGLWAAQALIGILLLVFATVLVAQIFIALARVFHRALKLPNRIALGAAVAVLILFAVGLLLLSGARVRDDVTALIERLPQDLEVLGDMVGIENLASRLTEGINQTEIFYNVVGLTSNLTGFISGLLVVLVSGVFLAASPHAYRDGILILFPPRLRARLLPAMTASGHALRMWLVGKLIMMAIVFCAITPGLFLIGTPSWLTLGILAGILEFIPFVGPIIAAVPALLIAFSEGGGMVFWVGALYLVVQQIENNFLIPVIQHHTVDIPPVLSLFAILGFAALFGPMGLLLAMPLTVVLMVMLKKLYLRDVLREDVLVPGEGHGKKKNK